MAGLYALNRNPLNTFDVTVPKVRGPAGKFPKPKEISLGTVQPGVFLSRAQRYGSLLAGLQSARSAMKEINIPKKEFDAIKLSFLPNELEKRALKADEMLVKFVIPYRKSRVEYYERELRKLEERKRRAKERKELTGLEVSSQKLLAALRENRRELEKADRKSTRLNSSHIQKSRMPSSA